MKKCIIMFALLVSALIVAVIVEKNKVDVPSSDLLIGENYTVEKRLD
ncbi:hypothetical protein R3X28_01155 [Maribacter sp. TH_r10]|nr:hypothetical protein [Maribacter luteus]MDV7137458.1 hypothetical protein [Maribacter sp. TH_r10]|tara:strand:+ start:3218 stop:3358 length:141 start_codon:yes stop_codon:yes gene_type:complete